MRVNIEGPYREHRGLAEELGAYITILKIIAITAIILMGIATINYLDKVMTEQANLTYQVIVLQQEIDDLSEDILKIEDSINEARKDSATLTGATLLGEYEISHYCLENYPHICNDGDSSNTASGLTPVPYYTVSADPSIPFGTILVIDGGEYLVADRGPAIVGKKLDLAVPTHAEALSRGVIYREVYVSD